MFFFRLRQIGFEKDLVRGIIGLLAFVTHYSNKNNPNVPKYLTVYHHTVVYFKAHSNNIIIALSCHTEKWILTAHSTGFTHNTIVSGSLVPSPLRT